MYLHVSRNDICIYTVLPKYSVVWFCNFSSSSRIIIIKQIMYLTFLLTITKLEIKMGFPTTKMSTLMAWIVSGETDTCFTTHESHLLKRDWLAAWQKKWFIHNICPLYIEIHIVISGKLYATKNLNPVWKKYISFEICILKMHFCM